MPSALALAIGHVEGFFAPVQHGIANRPQRNNNPGDIEYGEFAHLHGGELETPLHPGGPRRFAKFATADAGWAALDALLETPRYQARTISEAFYCFAPPDENNTAQYIADVTAKLGCKADALLSAVMHG